MTDPELTLDELKAILRSAAGEGAAGALDGDILDTGFADLGYNSLALLETGGRIERHYGITLADSTLAEAETPRLLLDIVNNLLSGAAA